MTAFEMIKSACGPKRNMTKFASDISEDYAISPASLYRIASGNIKEPVSEDLLKAIVEHADKSCTVTFEDLRSAFSAILNEQPSASTVVTSSQEHARRLILKARQTILDTAIASGAKVQSLTLPGDDQRSYDLALKIEAEGIVQQAFFDIRPALGYRNYMLIEQFVGKLALRETLPDDIYYLVFVKDQDLDDRKVPQLSYDTIFKKFGNAKKQAAALNIVCISYTDAPLPELRELCLGPDISLLSFNTY